MAISKKVFDGTNWVPALDNLENYLSKWIDQLDKKSDHPFINNQNIQHCPYAKAAWTNDKTKTIKVTDYTVDN